MLCLDRGGIVGEDGATHPGCYDMSVYRTIPGAIIAAPKDEIEVKDMMYSAMLSETGPYIIRYPRGYGEGKPWQEHEFTRIEEGKGEKLHEGSRIAVIAAGPMANRAKEAAEELLSQTGWAPSIYNIRYIKPIDTEILDEVYENFETVITIEDGSIIGGLHGAVAEHMSGKEKPVKVVAVGIPDTYLSQGTQKELRAECNLTKEGISGVISEELKKISKKD